VPRLFGRAEGTPHEKEGWLLRTRTFPWISKALGTVVAVTMVVALAGQAASAASAVPATRPTPTATAAAIQRHEIAAVIARLPERDKVMIRHERALLAHMSTRQVEQLLLKSVKTLHSAHISLNGLGYSRTGDTIWLTKSEVVVWSVAAVAAIVGVLMVLGVPGATADVLVGSIVGTLVGAVFLGECAWITYNNPRSWGHYHC
jgi:hypothetical protein